MSSSVSIRAKKENPIIPSREAIEVSRYMRDAKPAHYILKINSFSLLSQSVIQKYESIDFEAGGYKWRLCLHPNGNTKRSVGNHISLYLAISDTRSFPQGWEVNAQFKFFVYDHIRDKYLTIQEADDRVWRFHWLKTEWGFDKLLPLELFYDTSSGYIYEDSCVFGAEVFVNKYEGTIHCLEMKKETEYVTYTWKIDCFSAVKEEVLKSVDIEVGELKWKLVLYPKGRGEHEGKFLQLGLEVADDGTLPRKWKVDVKYKLQIKDQLMHKHEEIEDDEWLCDSGRQVIYRKFLVCSDLMDEKRGFLVNDTLIVEAEIKVIAMMKNLTTV